MLACAHPITVQVPWRGAARTAFFTSSTQALSGLVRMEFIRRRMLFLLFFYLRNFACKYFRVRSIIHFGQCLHFAYSDC